MMEYNIQELVDYSLGGQPYESYSDYLKDQFGFVQMYVGLYLEALENGDFESVHMKFLENYIHIKSHVKSRIMASKPKFFFGEYFKNLFSLTGFEWFCVLSSVLIEFDRNYLLDFLKIDNNPDSKNLSYELLFKIYSLVKDSSDASDFSDIYFESKQKLESICFVEDSLKCDPCIFEAIISNISENIGYSGMKQRGADAKSEALIVHEELSSKLFDFLKNIDEEPMCINISGIKGVGKKTIVRRACDMLGKDLIEVDFNYFSTESKESLSKLVSIFRLALITDSYLCFYNFEAVEDSKNSLYKKFIFKKASNFSQVVFVLSNSEKYVYMTELNVPVINFFIDELSDEESFRIWKKELSEFKKDKNLNIREISNKFQFTPLQIKNTCKEAKLECKYNHKDRIDSKMLSRCAHHQTIGNLSDKAVLIKKKHTWDDIVLPPQQKELLVRACNQIKYKHIVYDKWGMSKRILYGRGLSMLFTGPPGTGKTMAAQVVASDLDLEVYRVDLSKVISKYIGESEKNLSEVFESAKKSNAVLLFDETDALFGKRTEVKDSHDKHANVETSYLLQKMEEYSGITIMTTNFIENIDKAFFRRINYVVHFNLPDFDLRLKIWKKMFPKKTPISDDVNFEYLAKNFEIAGGSIKNIVLTSSFMAASESDKVEMKHIIKSIEYELKKQGKMVSKSDFAQYAYLL